MIELPEAVVIARQVNQALVGKQVVRALANHSPHKFAWYTGDPASYHSLLSGKTIRSADYCAGEVEIIIGDRVLVLGAAPRYHAAGEKLPAKHQLLLEFADYSALSVTIQMWGAILCLGEGEMGSLADHQAARVRPSPLSDAFDWAYFQSLFDDEIGKMSSKEFLATKQRIPGLGNGVLQDILWTARVHPRRKMKALSDQEVRGMFDAVKTVLRAMSGQGGRDTERDLFGREGGYITILSKNTAGKPCPACGTLISKEAFLGGAIYTCAQCQTL